MENNLSPELPEVFSEESFNSLSILEKALYYSRVHNLWVMPVENSMKEEGWKRKPNKEPKDRFSWWPYKIRKPIEEEIIEWFKRGDANLAILAGKIYGIVVLDIDCHSPGYDGSFIQTHEIPETWKSKTWRGGYHYYFRYPIWIKVDSTKMKDKWLEFMSDGSYLVEAWSKYIDWDKVFEYTWEPGHGPWDMEVAEMPQWLIDLVSVPSWATLEVSAPKKKKDWWNFLQEIHPEWERNNTLASVAGYIFLKLPEDKWEDTAIPFLLEYNKTKLLPSLPDKEALNTIRSIMKTEKNRRNVEWFTEIIDNITGNGKTKLSDKVLSLVQESTELIKDQDGNLFLVDLADPRKKLYPIDSEDLLDFITHTYFTEFRSTIGQDTVKNVAVTLRSIAKHSGKKRTTYIRAGYNKQTNTLYYDLNNQAGEIIKITEDNMEIVPQGDVLFRRFHNMDEQVRPINCVDTGAILKYFNINSDEDKHLFLVYMISLFIPHIDMPLLVLNGQAGTGKSSFFKFVKELVDPPVQKKLTWYSFPSKQKDLEIQLTRWYFHTYDNLSGIKKDISDIFCQVVTWGGYSTKKNYTDEDMIDRTFVVRLWIGSIEKVIWYKDLIDRSLMFNLETIGQEINPNKIMEDFIADKPEILDFIFCTLALTLGNTDEITSFPRMWDFVKWWEKISRTLWYEKDLFLHRYREKIKRQHRDINVEIIPSWVMDILEYVFSLWETWDGEPNKLFSIAVNILKLQSAPNEPSSFSKTLYKYIPHLKTLGIHVEREHSGNRNILISRKIPGQRISLDTSDTWNEKTGEDSPNESPSWSEEESIE